MKPILKPTRLLVVMIFAAFAISCSDDGKDGEDGLNGEPGTANVIYSEWLAVPAGAPATIDGTSGLLYNFAAPEITTGILETGAVLAYLRFSTETVPLPHTSRAGGTENTIAAYPALGNLKVFRFRHDGGTPAVPISSLVTIRYIIIPGGTPAARQVNYRNKSYEEICALFGIPE